MGDVLRDSLYYKFAIENYDKYIKLIKDPKANKDKLLQVMNEKVKCLWEMGKNQ